MRYVLRHIFIFFFIIELGILAMIYKPVTESRANTRISVDAVKTLSNKPEIIVTRFPDATERNSRATRLLRDLATGAEASGLNDTLGGILAFVERQKDTFIVAAPSSNY